MRTFKITVPIFRFELFLATKGTIDEAMDFFKKQVHWVPIHDSSDVEGCFWGNENVGCMWLKNRTSIHHEVQHAVFHFLRFIGIPLVEGSEEVYTYLTDWLVKEIQHGFK